MRKKKVPKCLWDFGLVYEAELLSRMSRGHSKQSGHEEVTGNTPDISEWLDFGFCDLVWWLDRPNEPDVADNARRLAQWLGVSHRVGSDLCHWLITESGQLVSKTSVEHVIQDDYLQEGMKKRIDEFNQKLEACLDDSNFQLKDEQGVDLACVEDIEVDDHTGLKMDGGITPADAEHGDMLVDEHPDNDEEEAVDQHLNVELIMDVGTENERRGRVLKRSRGQDGQVIGRAHANPLFDTREYDVEFTDGAVDKCAANIIAEKWRGQHAFAHEGNFRSQGC